MMMRIARSSTARRGRRDSRPAPTRPSRARCSRAAASRHSRQTRIAYRGFMQNSHALHVAALAQPASSTSSARHRVALADGRRHGGGADDVRPVRRRRRRLPARPSMTPSSMLLDVHSVARRTTPPRGRPQTSTAASRPLPSARQRPGDAAPPSCCCRRRCCCCRRRRGRRGVLCRRARRSTAKRRALLQRRQRPATRSRTGRTPRARPCRPSSRSPIAQSACTSVAAEASRRPTSAAAAAVYPPRHQRDARRSRGSLDVVPLVPQSRSPLRHPRRTPRRHTARPQYGGYTGAVESRATARVTIDSARNVAGVSEATNVTGSMRQRGPVWSSAKMLDDGSTATAPERGGRGRPLRRDGPLLLSACRRSRVRLARMDARLKTLRREQRRSGRAFAPVPISSHQPPFGAALNAETSKKMLADHVVALLDEIQAAWQSVSKDRRISLRHRGLRAPAPLSAAAAAVFEPLSRLRLLAQRARAIRATSARRQRDRGTAFVVLWPHLVTGVAVARRSAARRAPRCTATRRSAPRVVGASSSSCLLAVEIVCGLYPPPAARLDDGAARKVRLLRRVVVVQEHALVDDGRPERLRVPDRGCGGGGRRRPCGRSRHEGARARFAAAAAAVEARRPSAARCELLGDFVRRERGRAHRGGASSFRRRPPPPPRALALAVRLAVGGGGVGVVVLGHALVLAPRRRLCLHHAMGGGVQRLHLP